jgi:hypothetical protein
MALLVNAGEAQGAEQIEDRYDAAGPRCEAAATGVTRALFPSAASIGTLAILLPENPRLVLAMCSLAALPILLSAGAAGVN